jgi:8-oxo-dGTP pyrophosphatase MutT (NUDIX family)
MTHIKNKAFAYITSEQRLLVFRHPDFPEAGIQVPAGTIEPGEQPEAAVMREAFEETGLTALTLVSFLGEQMYAMTDFERDELHHRHFYHLHCAGNPSDTWLHEELYPQSGEADPIIFEFFWAKLPDGIPPLIADHDVMLPLLIKNLLSL